MFKVVSRCRVLRLQMAKCSQNEQRWIPWMNAEKKKSRTLLNCKDLHILKRLLLQQNMNIIRPFWKEASNLFHLTKTRPSLHCVLRVEGHWSMPRTGNSSEFNTLSAQFIYCCVSNGPAYCESTWKRGTKAPPYATENSGHKEGASLLNRS